MIVAKVCKGQNTNRFKSWQTKRNWNVLKSETEIALSVLPVHHPNPAFAALTSIHYAQMPKVKFSEAHSIAKSSIFTEYKVAFVRHQNILLHILWEYIHIYKSGHGGSWASLARSLLPKEGKVLQHYQDLIVKKIIQHLTIKLCEIPNKLHIAIGIPTVHKKTGLHCTLIEMWIHVLQKCFIGSFHLQVSVSLSAAWRPHLPLHRRCRGKGRGVSRVFFGTAAETEAFERIPVFKPRPNDGFIELRNLPLQHGPQALSQAVVVLFQFLLVLFLVRGD